MPGEHHGALFFELFLRTLPRIGWRIELDFDGGTCLLRLEPVCPVNYPADTVGLANFVAASGCGVDVQLYLDAIGHG